VLKMRQREATDGQPPPFRSYGWQLAAFALVLARVLPNITYPIGRDQATYLVIGDGLLRGQQLYRDLWDTKPPGVFYIYSIVVKLLGHQMWSVGLLDIFWLLAISYFLFCFAKRHVGNAAAAVAVLLNATWHCRAGYVNAGQPETFIVLLVFAAAWLVASEGRWMMTHYFLAGLLLAAAFWIKYNAIAFLPLVLLVSQFDWRGMDSLPFRFRLLIPWQRWLWRTASLLSGFLIFSAAVLGYFWLSGSLPSLWEAQFKVVQRYVAMGVAHTPNYLALAVFSTIAAIGYWTLVAANVALLIAWKRGRFSRILPAFFGAALGYISAAMQLRFFVYGFETATPFFAIFWGFLLVEIYECTPSFGRTMAASRRLTAQVALACLFVSALFFFVVREVSGLAAGYQRIAALRHDAAGFYSSYPNQIGVEHLQGQLKTVAYLKENATATDQVYIWGAHPLIYHLTETRPPTRFVCNFPLMAPWGPPEWRAELIRTLKRSPPRYIVVARNDAIYPVTIVEQDSEQFLNVFPQLNAFLSNGYDPVSEFPDFVIYRRIPSFEHGTNL
jgi:hypothetical protein